MMRVHVAGLLSLLIAAQAEAQSGAVIVRADTVAAGVVHMELADPAGPWRAHVVRLDLRSSHRLVAVRARDSIHGREQVSSMAARLAAAGGEPLVGLNGDFFDLVTGENENNQVMDGLLLKGVRETDSPHDTFDNAHTQFAFGRDGRPFIDRFVLQATAGRPGGREYVLDAINGVPRSGVGLALFDSGRGTAPRGDTLRASVEVPLVWVVGPDSAARWYIAAPPRQIGREAIRPGGGMLAAYGPARARLDSLLADTGQLIVRRRFTPDRGPLALTMGGWPRVVTDGRSVAAAADSVEGTFPRFSAQRHPRTALAMMRDSLTLLLVAVDGRPRESGQSVGMTLTELADFLIGIGAWQALNLDGGGSTTLWVGNRTVNQPSDTTGERPVGNALFVLRNR